MIELFDPYFFHFRMNGGGAMEEKGGGGWAVMESKYKGGETESGGERGWSKEKYKTNPI